MIGETVLNPVVTKREGTSFDDFQIGEGYIDGLLEVRVRIDKNTYIHINSNVVNLNAAIDWPLREPVRIRYFKLIVEER